MEGKLLPNSKESSLPSNLTTYGTVNPCCDEVKSTSADSKDIMQSLEDKSLNSSQACSCPATQGCDCGLQKKQVQLEPWSRYKTITFAVGLSIFGIWIIVIAVIAKQGKL